MTQTGELCEVLHEGRWYPGRLYGQWRQVEGQWRAVVRYNLGPGEEYVQGRWAGTVRRRSPAEVATP